MGGLLELGYRAPRCSSSRLAAVIPWNPGTVGLKETLKLISFHPAMVRDTFHRPDCSSLGHSQGRGTCTEFSQPFPWLGMSSVAVPRDYSRPNECLRCRALTWGCLSNNFLLLSILGAVRWAGALGAAPSINPALLQQAQSSPGTAAPNGLQLLSAN